MGPAPRESEAGAGKGPAVDVRELSFTLLPGGPSQLDGVSLTLPRGARCVLVGQNGAGKSTLLELLSGSKMAAAGAVKVLGEDPFRGSSGCRIGLVQGGWRGSSSSAFGAIGEEKAAAMMVWEFLGLPGPLASSADAESSRLARLLDVLDLVRLMRRHCGTLSDGERRKAELARRLKEQKDVILLDEATTDLDIRARSKLLDFLAGDGAATVVLVTHVFDGLEGWATHLAHMHEGAVVRSEEVPESGRKPWAEAGGLFPFVASWISQRSADPLRGCAPPACAATGPPAGKAPAEASGPAVSANGLRFSYAPWCPSALALDGLAIPRGSRCVLVGPNGAGKSTLLSLVGSQRLLKDGDLEVLGKRAFHDHAELGSKVGLLSSSWKKQVSEIGAGRSLSFRELSASAMEDAIAAGGDAKVLAARMVRLVQILGVDVAKPLGAQSDGMVRRVQIALRLLRRWELLLVDEVTADLDVLSRQALLDFLREEADAGTTVVYCTHIFDGLAGWGSHLLRVRPSGHPHSLTEIPQGQPAGGDGGAAGALFRTVWEFMEEDARLPVEPATASPEPRRTAAAGEAELPSGWHSRATAQAGAYGSYSWKPEQGPEETWTFASSAPPPPSMHQAIASSVSAREEEAGARAAAAVAVAPAAGAGVGASAFLGAGAGGSSAAAVPHRGSAGGAMDNPFGPGPRGNSMPLGALISRGAVQPEARA